MKNKYILSIFSAIVGVALFSTVILFAIYPKSRVVFIPANNRSVSGVSLALVSSTTPDIVNPPEIISGVNSILFTSSDNDFKIWYPQTATLINDNDSFIFATKHGVARIMLPEIFSKGTNLVEAGVGIGVDSDLQIIAKCNQPVVDGLEKYVKTVNLGGLDFSVFEGSDAGAGHLYEYKTYRTVKNGRCYELVEAINSTNIGVYEPGTIKEFNKNYISSILDKIVLTFIAYNGK